MRKKELPEASAFLNWKQGLGSDDANRIEQFFEELRSHILLARDETRKLMIDFENVLLFYAQEGVSIDDMLDRLNPRRLSGFYARPPAVWYPLDDAAKIYPLSMRNGRMAVFRLSVYLKRPVVPELLQTALTFTITRFPSFATTVKSGLFWHYLDASKRRYTVEEEKGIPCRPLPVSRSGSQSFRVLFFRNRISIEFFHILTDGTGGLVFLKTLTAEYLRLLGSAEISGDGILRIGEIPRASETENAFLHAEKAAGASGFTDRPAVQFGGALARTLPCRILHFKLDTEKLLEAARQRGTTVTAYILAKLFLAGRSAIDLQSGEMSIQVPVNMRKFYPSNTVRNFAMYCGIRIPIQAIEPGNELIEEISQQLAEKTSEENMSAMMASTESMVHLLRYIPLAIKAPVARHVYSFLGESIFTNTLSNLGVVKLPDEMADQIECMDFVLGTASSNRASCAMITCGGTAMLSVTKRTLDPSFEEALCALLSEDGIPMELEGSENYEG